MDAISGGGAAAAGMAKGQGGGRAVGHQAKAAVAAARDAGADLPGNAQGLAASSIARGMDPGAVFAAYAPPPAPTEEAGAPVADAPAPEITEEAGTPDDSTDAESGATGGDGTLSEAAGGYAAGAAAQEASTAETALVLLKSV